MVLDSTPKNRYHSATLDRTHIQSANLRMCFEKRYEKNGRRELRFAAPPENQCHLPSLLGGAVFSGTIYRAVALRIMTLSFASFTVP